MIHASSSHTASNNHAGLAQTSSPWPCSGIGAPRNVVVVLPPGTFALDVAGMIEVFAEASNLVGRQELYNVQSVGLQRGIVEGFGGIRLVVDHLLEDVRDPFDTLCIIGSPRIDVNPTLSAWLARNAQAVRRIASTGSGLSTLAAAGLLDGTKVTTHQPLLKQFIGADPSIHQNSATITVHNGSIFTSAGRTAGVQLALTLVEDDFGRDLAVAVAQTLVTSSYQPPSSIPIDPQPTRSAPAGSVAWSALEYIYGNLTADLSIRALASRAHMSPRNLSRVFQRDFNMTPRSFVEMVRLKNACSMLESKKPLALKTVAYLCGFKTVSNMRRAFLRSFSVGPSNYRSRCRPELSEVRHLAARAVPLPERSRCALQSFPNADVIGL
ncbi:helix-turn-helix domain-containing protein [Microvirga terrae]|uniref:GlxA family transcriptional regulator n=1 Tax=Microvirga terrae TaxID=2740529 RepID=UPI00156F2322